LRQDMSVVGPRPPLPTEAEHYDDLAIALATLLAIIRRCGAY
jgi:lipopolysaccharide/colanic/teichoic acid biosynthesis glycosyltransferase